MGSHLGQVGVLVLVELGGHAVERLGQLAKLVGVLERQPGLVLAVGNGPDALGEPGQRVGDVARKVADEQQGEQKAESAHQGQVQDGLLGRLGGHFVFADYGPHVHLGKLVELPPQGRLLAGQLGGLGLGVGGAEGLERRAKLLGQGRLARLGQVGLLGAQGLVKLGQGHGGRAGLVHRLQHGLGVL